MARYQLEAPDGTPIRGTAENLPATAYIDLDSVTQKEDGTFAFEWSGTTECWWDAQETKTNEAGERMFDDENGNEWPESELQLVRIDDEDDDDED
jgi:hypothetical protein